MPNSTVHYHQARGNAAICPWNVLRWIHEYVKRITWAVLNVQRANLIWKFKKLLHAVNEFS
jgi:hypothetical protein